jgi:FkbM family methyltransferase
LGANIGFTTLYLSRFFPKAKYVCIEPDAKNAALLRRNVSWLGEQVRVIEGAVSDQSGYALFDASGQSWKGQLRPDDPDGIPMRCYTMDELVTSCGLSTIDILKVDIEGAEERLFGSQNEWLSKVKLIIVELHGHYTIERFQQDVDAMGFKVLPPSVNYGNHMIFALSPDTYRTAIKLRGTDRYATACLNEYGSPPIHRRTPECL